MVLPGIVQNVCQVLSHLSLKRTLQDKDHCFCQYMKEETRALRVKESYSIPHSQW